MYRFPVSVCTELHSHPLTQGFPRLHTLHVLSLLAKAVLQVCGGVSPGSDLHFPWRLVMLSILSTCLFGHTMWLRDCSSRLGTEPTPSAEVVLAAGLPGSSPSRSFIVSSLILNSLVRSGLDLCVLLRQGCRFTSACGHQVFPTPFTADPLHHAVPAGSAQDQWRLREASFTPVPAICPCFHASTMLCDYYSFNILQTSVMPEK